MTINTAKIIAVTNPLIQNATTGENLSPQEFIAYAARVSNPGNQNNHETAEKLLKYCIRNNHWSIFEMVNVVMEINTTRDIARQILRHRSFSFQEFSQRYADPTESMGFVTREARLQDKQNRQNSIVISEEAMLHPIWEEFQTEVIEKVEEVYKWAIDNGIAKEQARAVLPEGLTKSRLYMNGTLRSWITYIKLRIKNGTQKEHSMVAQAAYQELMQFFPFMEFLEKEENNK